MSYFDDIPLWARIMNSVVQPQTIIVADTPQLAQEHGTRIGDQVVIVSRETVVDAAAQQKRKGWPKGKPRKPVDPK